MTLPPGKDSKRERFLKVIQHGYDKIVNATKSPSRPASPHPDSVPTLSDGGPHAFIGSPTITNLHPASISSKVHSPSVSKASVGPAIPGASLKPISTHTSHATDSKLAAGGRTQARGMAFSGLEMALRALEKSAHVLPPLKEALSELVACLDTVQSATEHMEDYQQLTSEFTRMADTLSQYITELGPEASTGGASRIAQSIEAEVARINKRRGRSTGRQIVESAQDKDDIVKSYRKIEGLFRELQNDIGLQTWRNTNKIRMMSLLQGMSPVDDARYNSSYSSTIKRRGCTAKTREKVQADIQNWIRDPNGSKVYWMNGMAGTGKTTIAYSLCEWLEANHQLGASFFCSRVSSPCRNVNLIVPTIAYQLTLASSVFQSALCKVLEADLGTSKLNVVQQFEKLVRMPLLGNKDAIPKDLVVVIDALDECEDDYGVRLILGMLLKLCIGLPLKFLVTSRPEASIQDNMLSPTGYSPAVLHLHDIEQSVVEDDIRKYLTEALESVQPPPSVGQIEQLAATAGKLFIYAATTARYITSGKGNPIARLESMLAADRQPTENKPLSKRYKELDALYTSILSIAINGDELEEEEAETIRLVLWTVVCAKEPMTTPALASFVDISEEQLLVALKPLYSVLHVSEGCRLVSTLHASFPDYILDQRRSKIFYCDQPKHSGFLAHRCFDVMKEQLKFNICRLNSSFVLDEEVHDLDQRIETYIPPILAYTCRYWGDHLRLAVSSEHRDLCKKLADFLELRILFWIEIMNLKKCVANGILALVQAETWLSAMSAHKDIQKQATDARDFVARFSASAATRSTPHIYLSVLPFCPRTSSVYAHYRKYTRGLLEVDGVAIRQRDRAAQATWTTDSIVFSIDYSHDGVRVASGSDDGMIRVWDSRTGEVVASPSQGHISQVNSVIFSPDDTRIASGSSDGTIRLWDVRTGDAIADPFEGHDGSVNSVAFSPDGTQIVSGSNDYTIRVWDARTGEVLCGPFKGHSSAVSSVAFSPDGGCIVSGSSGFENTVRVWDARTGNAVAGPFKSHTGWVNSVAFSPDGTRIASGSADKAIRVWDACTGHTVAGPFEGHTDQVTSVAFSPDGTLIASGSYDTTIRVWDARTGNVVAGPFIGHIHFVNCVAFSPNGTQITSGSCDLTIQVWDTHALNTSGRLLERGHTNEITSVVFSPDGERIVSGAHDEAIRVWDAHTGQLVVSLFNGYVESVKSVAFSSDGTRIISGSESKSLTAVDNNIRVWDARTGEVAIGPLKGHTSAVNSVTFSPDSTLAVSGSDDTTIRVWDIRTGDVVAEPFKCHSGVNSVVFSPDGMRIASGSNDGAIRIWGAHTGDIVAGPFEGHGGSVRSIAFSPDGGRLASGSDDATIRVWDAYTGATVSGPLEGHTSPVNSVAFSPDGAYIVSGSNDKTARVWDLHTGHVVAGPFKGHTAPIRSVAFSPDGVRIISGSDDQAIRVSNIYRSGVNAELYHQLQSCTVISRGDSQSTSEPDYHDNPGEPSTNTQELTLSTPQPLGGEGLSTGTMDFECHASGWVTSNGKLLFWTPSDLRTHIPYPQDEFVIGVQGSLSIGYRNVLLGGRWTECYISP